MSCGTLGNEIYSMWWRNWIVEYWEDHWNVKTFNQKIPSKSLLPKWWLDKVSQGELWCPKMSQGEICTSCHLLVKGKSNSKKWFLSLPRFSQPGVVISWKILSPGNMTTTKLQIMYKMYIICIWSPCESIWALTLRLNFSTQQFSP